MFVFDESKACKNCLLPEPFAHLNADQICDECVNYRSPALKGMESLKKELERTKGKYDCIVGISGGRDSTYALYVVKRQLNLNPLAFNHNNEFIHEQAISNMKTVCKNLGVDFVSIVSKRNICHKIVADQLRMASQFGPAVLEAHLCGPCNIGVFLAGLKLAVQEKIPIAILGNSEEELLPDYLKKDKRVPLKKKIVNRRSPYFFRSHYYRLLQKLEFSAPLRKIASAGFKPGNEHPQLQKAGGLKIISIFDYIRWDRRQITSIIQNELGWNKPDHLASSWRFDCRLIPLVNYLWVKACGYPKAFLGHVQMIRSGTMTKKEALEQLVGTDWGEFTREMEEFLLNDLQISQKHIDIIKSY